MGQADFTDTFANWLDVSGVPEAKSFNSGNDFGNGLLVRESGKPSIELIGFSDLEQLYPIDYKLVNDENS
jgi:hypothetical protein